MVDAPAAETSGRAKRATAGQNTGWNQKLEQEEAPAVAPPSKRQRKDPNRIHPKAHTDWNTLRTLRAKYSAEQLEWCERRFPSALRALGWQVLPEDAGHNYSSYGEAHYMYAFAGQGVQKRGKHRVPYFSGREDAIAWWEQRLHDEARADSGAPLSALAKRHAPLVRDHNGLVVEAGGVRLQLHASNTRKATGYVGVSEKVDSFGGQRTSIFVAKDVGEFLGAFGTAVEAARAYSQHMLHKARGATKQTLLPPAPARAAPSAAPPPPLAACSKKGKSARGGLGAAGPTSFSASAKPAKPAKPAAASLAPPPVAAASQPLPAAAASTLAALSERAGAATMGSTPADALPFPVLVAPSALSARRSDAVVQGACGEGGEGLAALRWAAGEDEEGEQGEGGQEGEEGEGGQEGEGGEGGEEVSSDDDATSRPPLVRLVMRGACGAETAGPMGLETQKEFALRIRLAQAAASSQGLPAKKMRPPPLPQHLALKQPKPERSRPLAPLDSGRMVAAEGDTPPSTPDLDGASMLESLRRREARLCGYEDDEEGGGEASWPVEARVVAVTDPGALRDMLGADDDEETVEPAWWRPPLAHPAKPKPPPPPPAQVSVTESADEDDAGVAHVVEAVPAEGGGGSAAGHEQISPVPFAAAEAQSSVQ